MLRQDDVNEERSSTAHQENADALMYGELRADVQVKHS